MELENIRTLLIETKKAKSEYETAINKLSNEEEKTLKEKNLSIGNDSDLDKIVEISMELSEEYKTDELYRNHAKKCDSFIFAGLDYIINNPPDGNGYKAKIKTLQELKEILTHDIYKIVIYRERIFNILSKFSFFKN